MNSICQLISIYGFGRYSSSWLTEVKLKSYWIYSLTAFICFVVSLHLRNLLKPHFVQDNYPHLQFEDKWLYKANWLWSIMPSSQGISTAGSSTHWQCGDQRFEPYAPQCSEVWERRFQGVFSCTLFSCGSRLGPIMEVSAWGSRPVKERGMKVRRQKGIAGAIRNEKIRMGDSPDRKSGV